MRWSLDPAHTSIEFSVRHMMIATVKGTIRLKEGYVETDESGKPLRVTARLDAKSIYTGVPDRDNHLRSPRLFGRGEPPRDRVQEREDYPLGRRPLPGGGGGDHPRRHPAYGL